jgi:hypothetical protein
VRTNFIKERRIGIVSREKKRKIRIQIHELIESECMDCQYRRGYENAHFCIKECPVGKKLKSLSDSLEGKTTETSDQVLNKGRWSEEEVFYLLNHLEHFKIPHLASKLNRPPGAVHSKAASLKRRLKVSSC